MRHIFPMVMEHGYTSIRSRTCTAVAQRLNVLSSIRYMQTLKKGGSFGQMKFHERAQVSGSITLMLFVIVTLH